MPIYEYRCAACATDFERLLPRWDSPTPACPACGAVGAARVPSRFAVSGGAARPAGEPVDTDRLSFSQRVLQRGRVPAEVRRAYQRMRAANAGGLPTTGDHDHDHPHGDDHTNGHTHVHDHAHDDGHTTDHTHDHGHAQDSGGATVHPHGAGHAQEHQHGQEHGHGDGRHDGNGAASGVKS